MVSESVVSDVPGNTPETAQKGLDFEIVDETSAEQVKREQRLLASAPGDSPKPEPRVQSEPDPGTDIEPHVEAEPASESSPAPSARPQEPRTYSQAEVSKMQAAWAKQIDQARRSESRANEQLRGFNVDAAVEAMLRSQEAELASEVGVEKASRLVRSLQNTAAVRKSIDTQQQLRRSEAGRMRAIEQRERQARFIVAQSLAKEHGVAADDFELLVSASTPKAMQGLAHRLGGAGKAAVRDRVPPETPQTQLENGYHAGPQPENAERRLDRIRAKPSWEWTEADLQYMKTGEVR